MNSRLITLVFVFITGINITACSSVKPSDAERVSNTEQVSDVVGVTEVHLHPSLQSKFIETLLSLGERNKYFIETHSEHIIRKLQVLIKNNEYDLKSEDVTIHYFKRGTDKFEITNHVINENGKLTPKFPGGFFDNSYNLIKDLL
mgnify:CR=1 FL=1